MIVIFNMRGDIMKRSMKKRNNINILFLAFAVILGVFALKNSCIVSKAAVNKENTDTNKVELDPNVKLASTEKYKNMDYSFLKEYSYGSSVKSTAEFENVEEMKCSNVKEGRYVKTNGYYTSGDMGAACYLISKEKTAWSISLQNGLYANIQIDTYNAPNGEVWAVGNIVQFGAIGDGVTESHDGVNMAIKTIGSYLDGTVKTDIKYTRGIVFMPKGEYKIADQIHLGYSNLNVIGEGDSTVLFTDNDYRDEEGYSEFLWECWGAYNTYLANFKLEAREVNLYHYMRQLVILYSENVYVYKVNMIISQATYGSYYMEDKQYSNFHYNSRN